MGTAVAFESFELAGLFGVLFDFCSFFELPELLGCCGGCGGVISSLETIFTCPAAMRSRINCC